MPSSFSLLFPRPYLLVANLARKGPVLRYDPASGDFVDSFVAVDRPDPQFGSKDSSPFDVQIGPDGGVYVLILNPRELWRYSLAGKFASVFVPAGSGGFQGVASIVFGPDGNLYVGTTKPLIRFGPRVIYTGQIVLMAAKAIEMG